MNLPSEGRNITATHFYQNDTTTNEAKWDPITKREWEWRQRGGCNGGSYKHYYDVDTVITFVATTDDTLTGRSTRSNIQTEGDPVQKLKKLKQLRDEGLIEEDYYQNKRQEILNDL